MISKSQIKRTQGARRDNGKKMELAERMNQNI